MRVNVYAEELTTEVEMVIKEANGKVFYGVRLFLASPDELHHSPGDDDRSAVTFFVPWTASWGHDFDKLREALHNLIGRVDEAQNNYTASGQGRTHSLVTAAEVLKRQRAYNERTGRRPGVNEVVSTDEVMDLIEALEERQ